MSILFAKHFFRFLYFTFLYYRLYAHIFQGFIELFSEVFYLKRNI